MNVTEVNSTSFASYPEANQYLRKKLLLAGFKDYPPLVLFSKCPTWSMKLCPHPGSDAEFLRIALKLAGFDYEVIQHSYSTADEIISAINNGTADMSLLALRVKEDRLSQVRYTSPINYLQYGYLAKQLDKLESDSFLTLTFHFEIYLVLIASIFVVALIFRLEFSFTHRNYWDFLWYVFGTFFNQDKRIVSIIRSTAIRILSISWIYFAWIIINYYQAGLKYYLMVPLRHGVAFRNLQQVLDAMEYHGWIGVQNVNGYGPDLYCKSQQCHQLERIKAMGHFITIPQNDIHLAEELSKSNHVGFGAFSVDLAPYDISIYDQKDLLSYNKKQFLFIRDTKLSYEVLAYAINKNLTMELELINRALSRIISSYATIRNRYLPSFPPYNGEVNTGVIVLTMVHLQDVFNIFFSLCITGVVIFGIEVMYYRLKWTRYSVDEEEMGKWNFNLDLRYKLQHLLQFIDKLIKFVF